MTLRSAAVFDLPERLAHKADPALIEADEQHFAAIARSLEEAIADLVERLADARRDDSRDGQEAMDRDLEVHRLTARLRTLRRYGLDLCLGRMVADETLYVGRLGLQDADGRRLLIDWRSPAAEPFFAATHAKPLGLVSRRRYRWTLGRVTDYWDEVFDPDAVDGPFALDEDSALIAGLGASRSPRMRDVLTTIQADQDAIIRADSAGALVVDGGPGTGKTVVALHRAAYLLYADPRLGPGRGGVLFIGPHQPHLNYVADVLPSLGEEGVQTATLRDLLPEGVVAVPEALSRAIEPAVRLYEDPPRTGLEVTTPWGDLWLGPEDWAAAFEAPDPGTPHNEARELVREEVLTILTDAYDGDEVSPELLRRSLQRNADLRGALNRAWPLLEPTDLVGDLWTVPAYLRRCVPGLTPEQAQALQRNDSQAWTVSDLPLLDAARRRLGDPDAARRARRREATLAAQRDEMDRVVEHLVASDDSEMLVMSMLRGSDLQRTLVDESGVQAPDPDLLAGPFAHVVVDEAQELTDAEWQMLLDRCPSRSFTIVGDRAQARHGFTESWQERLARVGFDRVAHATLTVNYRTPAEVMAEAESVIRAVIPDANVPTSIRSTGAAVERGPRASLDAVLEAWADAHPEGIACVIGDPGFGGTERVRSLAPELVKGLEFDLVVLVDPERFGDGIEGAVDRYVAMTRATQRLVVLSSSASGSATSASTSSSTSS